MSAPTPVVTSVAAPAPAPAVAPELGENEWDDEDSAAEARAQEQRGGACAEDAAAAIVPIEAAALAPAPPPMRQSSVLTADSDTSSSSDSDDDGELLLQPPVNEYAARAAAGRPLGSPAAAHLLLARGSPMGGANAAAAAASASMLHDAMSNPPPPTLGTQSSAVSSSHDSASALASSPPIVGRSNVISLKRPVAALAGVKSETTEADSMQVDDSDEEEEEDEGPEYSPLDDDGDDALSAQASSVAAVKQEAAEPAVTAGSTSTKLRISLKSGGAATAKPVSVKKEEVSSTLSSAMAAVAAARAAAAAAAAATPATLIPPSTALTPHGRATLARYRSYFFDRQWQPLQMQIVSGKEVTDKFVRACALRTPFIATSPAELGMTLPSPHADVVSAVRAVCSALPAAHELSVIDVATQSVSIAWTLAQWADYFATPAESRTAVCNVISCEISASEFAQQHVQAPQFVRQLDWMSKWPKEVPVPEAAGAASGAAATSAAMPRTVPIPAPAPVQKYCLMGAAGSYTDFHADAGGSSVWYHVVHGRKLFLVIEPTSANMAVYETWLQDGKQLTIFLPDRYAARDRALEREQELPAHSIVTVRLLSLEPGQTLFVPGGWIHAVYTPLDSLVFGGNFLHSFSMPAQLIVYNQELNTGVARRFQFPYFEALHWIWAREYVFRLREPLAQMRVTLAELHGLSTLVKTLAVWMAQSAVGMRDGYDASRPRLGSKMPPRGHEAAAAAAASLTAEMGLSRNALDWAHNIPMSWEDACTLLRELDCLCHYNRYLIEREELDDRVEMRREAADEAAAQGKSPRPASALLEGEELSAEGWGRREQLAHKCFQLLGSFRHNTYPLVPMVHVLQLPFLRKVTRGRMNAAAAAANRVTGAKRARNPAFAAAPPEPEETKAAPPPTASGRQRHRVAKYAGAEFVSGDDEDDEDEAMLPAGAEDASASAAAASSADATAASAAPADVSPSKQRRVREDSDASADEEASEDAYSSDSGASSAPPSDEDDGDFDADEGKRRGRKGRKKARTAAPAAAATDDASAAPVMPVAPPPGKLNLAELQARAKAAAAAAGSQTKKVIPAGAKIVKRPRAKPAPAAAAAGAAPAGKAKPPTLSAKARIMQKLGLSGKLR